LKVHVAGIILIQMEPSFQANACGTPRQITFFATERTSRERVFLIFLHISLEKWTELGNMTNLGWGATSKTELLSHLLSHWFTKSTTSETDNPEMGGEHPICVTIFVFFYTKLNECNFY